MDLNGLTLTALFFAGVTLVFFNKTWADFYGVAPNESSTYMGILFLAIAYVERTIARQNENRSTFWALTLFAFSTAGFGKEEHIAKFVTVVLGIFHLMTAALASGKKVRVEGSSLHRAVFTMMSFLFSLHALYVLMLKRGAAYEGDANKFTYLLLFFMQLDAVWNPPRSTSAAMKAWFMATLGMCLLEFLFCSDYKLTDFKQNLVDDSNRGIVMALSVGVTYYCGYH